MESSRAGGALIFRGNFPVVLKMVELRLSVSRAAGHMSDYFSRPSHILCSSHPLLAIVLMTEAMVTFVPKHSPQ